MDQNNREAVRALVKQRRNLLNRIEGTEAKLAALRRRLNLAEVKLVCFGHDMEKLRAARCHPRLFKGRSIIRRVAEIQRRHGKRMKPKELVELLARCDGLDPETYFVRVSGRRRVKEALKRARRHPTESEIPLY